MHRPARLFHIFYVEEKLFLNDVKNQNFFAPKTKFIRNSEEEVKGKGNSLEPIIFFKGTQQRFMKILKTWGQSIFAILIDVYPFNFLVQFGGEMKEEQFLCYQT